MKRTMKIAAAAAMAVSALTLSACSSSGGSTHKVVAADPNAKVDYHGKLSVLTKFGLQQLAPYFQNLAKEYQQLHPGVTVTLEQESDDSVKGKAKTLVASQLAAGHLLLLRATGARTSCAATAPSTSPR